MSKRGDPKLIGAFVVGAAVLLVAGIFLFGSGRIFSSNPVFIMFFEGSVKGLNVGAPVVFRGVKMGEVKEISLYFDTDDLSVRIPVLVEFDPKLIKHTRQKSSKDNHHRELIAKGLKAQLQSQSLLTGQLMIDLDFYPDRPIQMVQDQSNLAYPEIPTVPSTIEQLAEIFQKIDFKKIATDLSDTMDGINNLVQSPELMATIQNLNRAVQDLQSLSKKIEGQVDPLAQEVDGTLQEARTMFSQINTAIPPLAADLGKTAQAASEAVLNLEAALQRSTGEDSAFFYRLNKALEDISSMARSIQVWSDFAERHPEALLQGKGNSAER